MEPYHKKVPVLFWLAQVDTEGDIFYKLFFKKQSQRVTTPEFLNSIKNAGELCYPIICLN